MTMFSRFALMALGMSCGARVAVAASGHALNQPLSVRQLGMGDVSVVDGDVLRGWSNPVWYFPAGRRWELGAAGGAGFGAQQIAGFGAGGLVTPWLAIGGFMNRTGVRFDEVDAMGRTTGADISRDNTAYGLGGAARIGWWRGGVTIKGVGDQVGGRSASTLACDVGTAAVLNQVMLAAAVRNLGGELHEVGLASEFRIGAAYAMTRWDVSAGAEYVGITERAGVVGLGVNWNPDRLLGLRSGVRFGPDQPVQVTAGASVAWRSCSVDYAAVTHPLGVSHRAGLTVRFGRSLDESSVENQ